MTYQQTIKENLGHYRKEVLHVDKAGIYNYRGRELRLDHILPKDRYTLNILESYRDDFFSSEFSDINLHKYFHHLNSSQGLCINLFYPLIVEGRLDLVLKILDLQEMDITHAQFEFESDLENNDGRKTNFDFYLKGLESIRIYIELKYTEQKFGSAKNDQAHVDKYLETYLPLLRDNRFIKDEFKTMDHFLGNYQIMRNLVHLGESDYVVFLYPEANRTIHEQAKRAYDEILTEEGTGRLKLVSLVEAVEYIFDHMSGDRTKKHFDEFKRKYML